MTEQLMDDLTNEEHEALLLMSEHAIAAPLSPAAQAVLDAYETSYTESGLVAALQAAALYCTRDRRVLMTIAAELEAQP